jgi:hypothetical protein
VFASLEREELPAASAGAACKAADHDQVDGVVLHVADVPGVLVDPLERLGEAIELVPGEEVRHQCALTGTSAGRKRETGRTEGIVVLVEPPRFPDPATALGRVHRIDADAILDQVAERVDVGREPECLDLHLEAGTTIGEGPANALLALPKVVLVRIAQHDVDAVAGELGRIRIRREELGQRRDGLAAGSAKPEQDREDVLGLAVGHDEPLKNWATRLGSMGMD